MARRRDVKRVLRFEMAAEEVMEAKYEDMVTPSAESVSPEHFSCTGLGGLCGVLELEVLRFLC